MKNFLVKFFGVIAGIILFGAYAFQVQAALPGLTPFYLAGNGINWIPSVSTYQLGSSTNRIAKIWSTAIDTTSITIGGGGGVGSVTSVSVVSANGLAGTVATATTTPAITLSTTITGILQGNGTAISAATTTGSGNLVLATSPTLVTPALGTPSGLVGTNITGTGTGFTSGSSNALQSATTTVNTSSATAPSVNQVLTATDSTHATWQSPASAAPSATSGVSAGPSTSSTQTITHSLGRTPIVIRIFGIGSIVSSTSQAQSSFSDGEWNSSGNTVVYIPGSNNQNQIPVTSTSFAIFMDKNSGTAGTAQGVIQNVTSTSFDIVWTVSGTPSTFTDFRWEAQ